MHFQFQNKTYIYCGQFLFANEGSNIDFVKGKYPGCEFVQSAPVPEIKQSEKKLLQINEVLPEPSALLQEKFGKVDKPVKYKILEYYRTRGVNKFHHNKVVHKPKLDKASKEGLKDIFWNTISIYFYTGKRVPKFVELQNNFDIVGSIPWQKSLVRSH